MVMGTEKDTDDAGERMPRPRWHGARRPTVRDSVTQTTCEHAIVFCIILFLLYSFVVDICTQ